jgi:hypothetical protein
METICSFETSGTLWITTQKNTLFMVPAIGTSDVKLGALYIFYVMFVVFEGLSLEKWWWNARTVGHLVTRNVKSMCLCLVCHWATPSWHINEVRWVPFLIMRHPQLPWFHLSLCTVSMKWIFVALMKLESTEFLVLRRMLGNWRYNTVTNVNNSYLPRFWSSGLCYVV